MRPYIHYVSLFITRPRALVFAAFISCFLSHDNFFDQSIHTYLERRKVWGAFHLTLTSENLETVANGDGTEMKIPEQIPFATGSCRQFKLDVLVEWKAPMLNNAAQSFVSL